MHVCIFVCVFDFVCACACVYVDIYTRAYIRIHPVSPVQRQRRSVHKKRARQHDLAREARGF